MQNFEKPELMRKAGLILANTNGFGDLENNFTMRSVPHTLAMSTSAIPPSDIANDGTTNPPVHRTGWSGDGSPVGMVTDGINTIISNGSVRSFPVGAVIQHFTKTLNRQPGVDFRLPTEDELDALEAFMFSLGRQEEFDDFTTITLNNAFAEQGRKNYMGEGLPADSLNCNACHFNGGANTNPNFDFSISGVTPPAFESTNRSFAPRVEELLDQPGDVLAASALGGGATQLPFDDGFADGTDLFNAPTVIEAADTGGFFHSNQTETVEGMIAFYASNRSFRNPEMNPQAGAIVPLNGSQLSNVAAFIRILNADENSRQAIELIDYAAMLNKTTHKKLNIRLAISEIKDALRVLREGRLHSSDVKPLYRHAFIHLKRYLRRPWKQKHLFFAKAALQHTRRVMINRNQ